VGEGGVGTSVATDLADEPRGREQRPQLLPFVMCSIACFYFFIQNYLLPYFYSILFSISFAFSSQN